MIEAARGAGLLTGVMFGPLRPFLSDSQATIDALLDRAADLRIDRIWLDALNPRPPVWPSTAALLRAEFPDLLQPYRRVLFDQDARIRHLEEFRSRVDDAVRRKSLTGRVIVCM